MFPLGHKHLLRDSLTKHAANPREISVCRNVVTSTIMLNFVLGNNKYNCVKCNFTFKHRCFKFRCKPILHLITLKNSFVIKIPNLIEALAI